MTANTTAVDEIMAFLSGLIHDEDEEQRKYDEAIDEIKNGDPEKVIKILEERLAFGEERLASDRRAGFSEEDRNVQLVKKSVERHRNWISILKG